MLVRVQARVTSQSTIPGRMHLLCSKEVKVVVPDASGVEVNANMLQSKPIRLFHLLPVCRSNGLSLALPPCTQDGHSHSMHPIVVSYRNPLPLLVLLQRF